jgi:3-hydroxyisobutyrate dehydrogenase
MKIAFLGLGIMGAGMALRLVKAGFDVTVYNRNPARAAPLRDAGAKVAGSAREAAADADLIISMVSDDAAARAVWSDALAGARTGFVGIESSTVSPAWVKEWAGLVTAKGGSALDAPVTGSKAAAENGELTFLVGGDAAALDIARPAFSAMGKGVVHLGESGAGAVLKLINNFMCGVQLASLAEALVMIDRSGLDLAKAVGILANGSPGSPFVRLVSARMVSGREAGGDDTVHFLLRLMAKDLTYAKAEGEALGVDMTTVAAALAQVQTGVAKGFGDGDISALYKAMTA